LQRPQVDQRARETRDFLRPRRIAPRATAVLWHYVLAVPEARRFGGKFLQTCFTENLKCLPAFYREYEI
jgi:hypothetical protein